MDKKRVWVVLAVVVSLAVAGCTGQMASKGSEGDTNMTKVGEIQDSSVFRFSDDKGNTCYLVKANGEKVESIDCLSKNATGG